MTVSTGFTRQVFPGNGNTTTFTFGFAFPDPSVIQVFYTAPNGSTIQVSPGNYTLVPNHPLGGNPTPIGGTVTFNPPSGPIPLGSFLTIVRNLPAVQDTSLSNQGTLYQTTLEQAFDYNVMLLQQVAEAKMPGIRGPIIGVTDGSLANPGEVGEYLKGYAAISVAANITDPSQTLSAQPLMLPPGDWDCQAIMVVPFEVKYAAFVLSPLPPGLTDDMGGAIGVFTPTTGEVIARVIGARAQASLAVPTLLSFQVVFVNVPLAGTATMEATARRMR